ncbi:MAG: hypothetical protein RLZZ535_2383 [Cyanobacteriota bacterium]|jgi:hypothetical protein
MSEQLTIFEVCSDSDPVSLQNTCSDMVKSASDGKRKAIERYLRQGKKELSISVNKYSPGKRATEYYRVSYQLGNRKKHIHLRGGSTIAELANYRANVLQAMIDRGAELSKVLAAVATFNSGGS